MEYIDENGHDRSDEIILKNIRGVVVSSSNSSIIQVDGHDVVAKRFGSSIVTFYIRSNIRVDGSIKVKSTLLF